MPSRLPAALRKLRRLRHLIDPRFPAHVLRRAFDSARASFRDYERIVEPNVNPQTASIATRDRVIAPTLRNISLGEGASFGPRSRLLVRGNGPEEPSGRIDVGRHVRVGQNCCIEVFSENVVSVGDFTTVGDNCVFLGDVRIGKHCLFSWNIYISSGDHHARTTPSWLIHDQDLRAARDAQWNTKYSEPVVIDDDVWIGWGAFIKQGVHVGRGAIIGAYAVVTRDVPPYSVQAGVPSREIGKRLVFAPPAIIDAGRDDDRPYLYSGFLQRREDLPRSGSGVFACKGARVVAKGGRVERIRIRTRSTSGPGTVLVSLNGVPVGDLFVHTDDSLTDLIVPPEASTVSKTGLLAGFNVIDFTASSPVVPEGAPVFELLSIGLETAPALSP
jgi:acetyltransferase-like isoleucine patch superfamily enzyme